MGNLRCKYTNGTNDTNKFELVLLAAFVLIRILASIYY